MILTKVFGIKINILLIVKSFFAIVGLAMLIGAFFSYKNTSDFLDKGIERKATVVQIIESLSESYDEDLKSNVTSVTYHPYVKFVDEKGVTFYFKSSRGSNPSRYEIGEEIKILYDPKSPKEARVKGFTSNSLDAYMFSIILGGMGVVFSIIGLGLLLTNKNKKNLKTHLLFEGKRIKADIQSIELNTSIMIDGRNPYQIISHWKNPRTSRLHIFKSDNLWVDPTDSIKEEKIIVLIDENLPNKYWVDTSFLPKDSS